MGDPRKLRKKYYTPSHPWQGARILEENEIVKAYGLKNKKEVWRARSVLKNATLQAKKLSVGGNEQSKKESGQLLTKLVRLGLLKSGAGLGDVLGIKFEDVLNRRLQTLVYKSGLARTAKQARQFIVHGHIAIGGKPVDAPSHLVSMDEQGKIGFIPKSSLSDKEHPERIELKRDIAKDKGEKEILEKKDEKREADKKRAIKRMRMKTRAGKSSFGKAWKKQDKNKGEEGK